MMTARARLGAAKARLRGRLRRSSGARPAAVPGLRPRQGPLAGLESLVLPGPGRRVVILADASQRRELRPWLAEFARDDVHVISRAEAPEWGLEDGSASLHTADSNPKVIFQLKMLGALDIIVNLLPDPLLPEDSTQLEHFGRVFRFLKPQGSYILDRAAVSTESSKGIARWMELLVAADEPKEAAHLGRKNVELARSTGTVVVSRDLIIATKRLKHYVKLRHHQVERMLGSREPELEVTELDKRPGGELVSRAVVTSHGVDDLFPEVITYPEVRLRHYQGKVGLSGATLMFSGYTILPDSFRWPHVNNVVNPRLKSVSPDFGRIESEWLPRRTLKGNYYQLDCAYPGHYGHITTEVLSRMWGWDRAKEQFPDLKAILLIKPGSKKKPSVEIGLFNAYGIDSSDIVWVNEPVWLQSVVSAAPMWQNADPHYVHPDMSATWDRLTSGLTRLAPDAPTFDRIFVSRGGSLKHRTCRNSEAVEALFAAHGFEVIYPERLSLGEQAAIFSRATKVAGFGGSGMFNMMHSKNVETVIVLTHEEYVARNEHLFTSVLGADVHYYWSPPDIPYQEGGSRLDTFFSSWEFDFKRHGEDLEALLASL